MSTVVEIESAIEKLDPTEFNELRHWLLHHCSKRSADADNRKREVIQSTAGCMTAEEADDFARAVREAGEDVADSHDW